MSVLSDVFEKCRAEGRAALIGYYPAGFPTLEGSVEAVRTMVANGCDVVEVGIPYSDPMMDGPTIQAAANTALEAGFRVADVFEVVRAVAEAGAVPAIMSYWNPILQYGVERFAADFAAAGGPGRGRRVDRGHRRARGRPGVPGRAVVHAGTPRLDVGPDRRVRLRPGGHGRDRRP